MKCMTCDGKKTIKTCGLEDLMKDSKDIVWETSKCPVCEGRGKLPLFTWIRLKLFGL